MSDWTKRLEVATNIAILIAILLVCAVAAKRLWEPKPPAAPGDPQVGAKLSLSGVDWSKSRQTLVLAMSTGCHFCSESAGFYQRLLPAAASAGVRTLAVLPQPLADDRAYLDKLGIAGAEAVESPLEAVQVSGTPTVLLVDNQGKIRKVWVGKLEPSREEQVLASLH